MSDAFITLPGSERSSALNAHIVGPADASAQARITLVLRRRAEIPVELVQGPRTVPRESFAASYGADPDDVALVEQTLGGFGLRVETVDTASRRMVVSGTLSQLSTAFGAALSEATSTAADGSVVRHRHRTGHLAVPAQLDGVVVAVLGLDDRPQARPHLRRHASPQTSATFLPTQVGALYGFPDQADGTGQTIAIIELGGGFQQSDLDRYFSGLNLPTPDVTAVGVGSGRNAPEGDPGGPDGEVLLDIEVAGALAPGARQLVYFAANTDAGFTDAVSTAIHATPTPAAVSISWGGPEDSWTAQARTALDTVLADAAALGVTVTAAAGDSGSSDGVDDGSPHVDFPASSPHVLACGGTRLAGNAESATITSEAVWNDGEGAGATGGGVSVAFPQPAWQSDIGVPKNPSGVSGRGVPDVAGNADPATGYQVLVDGEVAAVGGTSAVAPLWAALVARLVQLTGRGLGLLQPLLYAGVSSGQAAPGLHDIVDGDNGAYQAAPGWDACTGLGTPDGAALVHRIRTGLGGQ